MRKHNVTTTGNSREQETKWKTKNEQMRKSHIYFFHNNLHFVNKTCWIMMIMAFGILMLGLYDLQVRRVLRYDQNDQDERRCKKIKDAKGEHGDLGYPRIILFFGLGSSWDNLAHLHWVPGILFSWHPWVPN